MMTYLKRQCDAVKEANPYPVARSDTTKAGLTQVERAIRSAAKERRPPADAAPLASATVLQMRNL
jgi:hypothetical protein